MDPTLRSELGAALRRRRDELLREAAAGAAALAALVEERDSEPLERAQEAGLRAALVHLGERERLELAQVDAALDRVADGSYGRCLLCSRTVPVARLRALPATPHCVACAAAAERLAAR
jgi:DnaK suppressor protein